MLRLEIEQAMSWWTVDKQIYAFNFLANSGLSPYGAAALVSRWKNVESSGGPASVNPYSGAFGIAQWLGSRKSAIAGNTSFEAQLAYVVAELNGAESRAGSILRSATDEYTGAVGASTYERAEGYNASTGVDNFTSRTAAGVGEVFRNATGGASGSQEVVSDNFFGLPVNYDEEPTPGALEQTQNQFFNLNDYLPGSANPFGQEESNTGTWLLVGAVAVLGLIWITQ